MTHEKLLELPETVKKTLKTGTKNCSSNFDSVIQGSTKALITSALTECIDFLYFYSYPTTKLIVSQNIYTNN